MKTDNTEVFEFGSVSNVQNGSFFFFFSFGRWINYWSILCKLQKNLKNNFKNYGKDETA